MSATMESQLLSYFIQHTKTLGVREEYLRQLWNENKVAIHFPGNMEGEDLKSLEPEEYESGPAPTTAKSAIRCFRELAQYGGYVWAQSRVSDLVKVGKVEPQPIEWVQAQWQEQEELSNELKRKGGKDALLKALSLSQVKELRPGHAMGLRAGRPQRQAISRWWKCRNGLATLVEEREGSHDWSVLSPEQQEAACAEYLRLHTRDDLPRLHRLLLPVGRTLEDVDIYGIDEQGKPLYAQVTYLKEEGGESRKKIDSLRKYGGDSTLVYFCRQPDHREQDGIFFVDVEREVHQWIKEDKGYEDGLFSS